MADRTVSVVPALDVTIPAELPDRCAEVLARFRASGIEEIIEEARMIRHLYTALRSGLPFSDNADVADAVDEALGRETGWTALWEALVGLGDELADQRFPFLEPDT